MSEREKMIEYCYAHINWYVAGFESAGEGMRGWNCLISMLENGSPHMSTAKDLQDHGMPYPEWQVEQE